MEDDDINRGLFNTNIRTWIAENKYESLSSELNIFINTPKNNFKLDKKFIEIFEGIELPKLSNYIDNFDDSSLKYRILDDYFFDLKEAEKKFKENIIQKNEEKIVLKGNEGLNNLKNLMSKLNKLYLKYIGNLFYKIKILFKEEILSLEENKKKYDYVFIILIRSNHEIYSYVFLLEKSKSPLDDIKKFLKDRNITAYEIEEIKKRVLSRNLDIKIDYIDYSSILIPFEEVKKFPDLKDGKSKINSEYFYSEKEIKYSNEKELNALDKNLEDIREKYYYYDSFDYFLNREENFLLIRSMEFLYLFTLKKN